jgi:hypothetical protein
MTLINMNGRGRCFVGDLALQGGERRIDQLSNSGLRWRPAISHAMCNPFTVCTCEALKVIDFDM